MLFRKLISAVVFCSGAFVVQPSSAFELPTYFKSDKMNENLHVKSRSALSSYRASFQGALNSKSFNDPQQANIKQVILQDYRRWQGVSIFGAAILSMASIALHLRAVCSANSRLICRERPPSKFIQATTLLSSSSKSVIWFSLKPRRRRDMLACMWVMVSSSMHQRVWG